MAGTVELKDVTIYVETWSSGTSIAVSLDGKPLATSRRILLQAMSEEKATDFRAEPASVRRAEDHQHRPRPLAGEGARRRREVQAVRRLLGSR